MKNFYKKYKNIIYVILTITLMFLFRKQMRDIYKLFSSPATLKTYISSFGKAGALILIILQIIQVIIFFIPGELLQIAGGYMYGTFWGTLISIIGLVLGSIVMFLIARRFGFKFLGRFIPKKMMIKLYKLINKPSNKLIIFILFMIPIFPKDILCSVCGITSIKFSPFVLLLIFARLPGIALSANLGSNLYSNNYILSVILMLLMALISILGILNKDKLVEFLTYESF